MKDNIMPYSIKSEYVENDVEKEFGEEYCRERRRSLSRAMTDFIEADGMLEMR
jgi:hypothetical protein